MSYVFVNDDDDDNNNSNKIIILSVRDLLKHNIEV